MGDQPSMADVMKLLQTLTTDMSKMQNDMATMQEKIGSSADPSVHSHDHSAVVFNNKKINFGWILQWRHFTPLDLELFRYIFQH